MLGRLAQDPCQRLHLLFVFNILQPLDVYGVLLWVSFTTACIGQKGSAGVMHRKPVTRTGQRVCSPALSSDLCRPAPCGHPRRPAPHPVTSLETQHGSNRRSATPRSCPEGRCGESWSPTPGYPPPLGGPRPTQQPSTTLRFLAPAQGVPPPLRWSSGPGQALPLPAPRGPLGAPSGAGMVERGSGRFTARAEAGGGDPCARGARAPKALRPRAPSAWAKGLTPAAAGQPALFYGRGPVCRRRLGGFPVGR